MAVTIEWDNPSKTILHYRFVDDWTWNGYLEQLQSGREMMASVSHDVCILNDMTQMKNLPPNFITLARSVIGTRPENTGLAIFVSTSAFFKTMHRVLGEVIPEVPTHYLLVTNEAEAYQRFEDWFASQSTNSSD
jgi:hypothetical protein